LEISTVEASSVLERQRLGEEFLFVLKTARSAQVTGGKERMNEAIEWADRLGRRAVYVSAIAAAVAFGAFFFAGETTLGRSLVFSCFLVVVCAQGAFFYSRWLKKSASK
jgi:hypothetical protein